MHLPDSANEYISEFLACDFNELRSVYLIKCVWYSHAQWNRTCRSAELHSTSHIVELRISYYIERRAAAQSYEHFLQLEANLCCQYQ